MERKIESETEEKAIDIRNWNLASIDLSSVSAADSAAQQRCIHAHQCSTQKSRSNLPRDTVHVGRGR